MYTIGEFSNLAHVSARSLRYYDAMGLLRPAHMGENGYRYYTGGQLPALAKIETLKSYGFTLAEVKELLLLPETELAHRIHVRRISAYAQLNEMRRVIRRMEAAIVQMEGTSMANDTYHVILMQAPAQKVFSVRRTIQIGEMHDLFAELRAQMKRAGVRRTGPTQARYHGEEFSYEHMDVEAQAAVDADGPNVSVIPAGTFAAVTHTGPYENIKYAYDALCGWRIIRNIKSAVRPLNGISRTRPWCTTRRNWRRACCSPFAGQRNERFLYSAAARSIIKQQR